MTRIESVFNQLTAKGKKGFIAYVTAGDPSLEDTIDIVLRLEDAGVDVVELGIPFSDPLADGRVNQESAVRALAAGATPGKVLDMIAHLREKTQLPIMCYTYLNPYHAAGYANMIRRTEKAGVDGVLFLDLPVEESEEIVGLLDKNRINNIVLVTPTSPEARVKEIVRAGRGFVYCVSRAGVTGMQDKLSTDADRIVKITRKHTKLPVALGFGISTPELAVASAMAADAIVVGSAIVNQFHQAGPSADGRRKATAWVAAMVKAVKEI